MRERSGGFTPNQALPSFGDRADTIVSPTLSVVKSRFSLICASVRPRSIRRL